MSTIKRLSDDVVMHIAAGQVVDKPVSVVKELLENAIDAKSTLISVEIQNGGYERIIVVDNGVGMSKSDVRICFQPHTTSKIVAVDDLIALSTHGFRGEALASIAAVGSLSIASRQSTSVRGWKIEVEKGACVTSEPVGMPTGTRVDVRDLFKDMPVRKGKKPAFTKSTQEILDCIIRLALIYQNIEFILHSQGKRILHAESTNNPLERLYKLFGEAYRGHLIPIKSTDVRYRISGFIGKPSIARAYQAAYFSVNNRPVRDVRLLKHIKEVYATLIPAQYYPFINLDISVPHEDIDVNIDPQKYTVQLYDASKMYQSIASNIKDLLYRHNLIPQPASTSYSLKMDTETQHIIRDAVDLWSPTDVAQASFLQVNTCFLVWEQNKNIYIADQHAVHERILYEQIKEGFYTMVAEKKTFTLLEPYVLHLSMSDTHLLTEYRTALETMGFLFSHAAQKWRLTTVPHFLKNRNLDNVVTEILHNLDEKSDGSVLDHITHATITYMACRKAIKAGDTVSETEAKKLIMKLFKCENPYTCPHGRPTVQVVTNGDLQAMFKRS